MKNSDKKMSLKAAEIIWKEFGAYIATSLESLIFGLKIPQSLLPYPKEKIKEALELGMEYYKVMDNKEAIETIDNSLKMLDWYIDDYEGIKHASNIWNSEKFREYVKKELNDFQQRNYQTLVKQVEEASKANR